MIAFVRRSTRDLIEVTPCYVLGRDPDRAGNVLIRPARLGRRGIPTMSCRKTDIVTVTRTYNRRHK